VPTLALDTSTGTLVVGLIADSSTLAERRCVDDGTAAQSVLVAVDSVLREARIEPQDLDRVVVGVGPGSFTATRIGIATARALADGWDLPVAGANGLDALRRQAGDGDAVAVIDARRGEVFAAAAGIPAGAYRPADLVDVARGGDRLVVGDGARRYRADLERIGVIPPDDDPRHTAGALALVAVARPDGEPTPCYLREPDAQPTAVVT
jgi:tRNA threonylcarbamoyladenosine biosynthesis protein TsaB